MADLIIGPGPGDHPGQRPRCAWGASTADYIAYHDFEWGVPIGDEIGVLERLCLEGFQAGLSWLTVLRKRDRFREVFNGFDPEVVAGYGETEIQGLLGDAGIIRHRGKIEATINNARATLKMHSQGESLAGLVWSFEPEPNTPPAALDTLPASTDGSKALSKELKKRGFRFVGPTTVYAALQAMGVVNDHLDGCWVREGRDLDRAQFIRPTMVRSAPR